MRGRLRTGPGGSSPSPRADATDGAPDDFLDVKAAALILGLGEGAVCRLAARGDLKVTGWPMKVRRAELAAYIERSRLRPGQLGKTPNQYRRNRPH